MYLAINGSYRDDGCTDRMIAVLRDELRAQGEVVEEIKLRDYPLALCLNCRECTQAPGPQPGQCVHRDGMQALIDKIEQARGLVLASPTNFGSVTAIFKRFMERLVVYAYWPWGQLGPQNRKRGKPLKNAVVLTSSAAPGLLSRLFFQTAKQLKLTAKTVGARPVRVVFVGAISQQPEAMLNRSQVKKLRAAAAALIRASQ